MNLIYYLKLHSDNVSILLHLFTYVWFNKYAFSHLKSKSEDNNIKEDSLRQFELDNDDDTELKKLSKLDRLRALEDVDDLYNSIHGLRQNYKIVDKLGEGTFSAVYKAIDLHHHSYDNSYWFTHDQIDKHQLSRKSKVYVALKRIYVTSCPYRIQNELEILYTLRYAFSCQHLACLN